MLRPVISLFLEKPLYFDKTMKKQRNIYKKWYKTEVTLFTTVTIKEAEFSRIISKTCKIGEKVKNGTFHI